MQSLAYVYVAVIDATASFAVPNGTQLAMVPMGDKKLLLLSTHKIPWLHSGTGMLPQAKIAVKGRYSPRMQDIITGKTIDPTLDLEVGPLLDMLGLTTVETSD